MKRLFFGAVGVVILGIGATFGSVILGCHNPTGYCGGNTPDPDRIGGPSWFFTTTPDERMKYNFDSCMDADTIQTSEEATACARTNIANDAHHYCVLYFLPPTRPKDDAEAAAREARFTKCKADILAQHDL
ncbi:MAG: hypothetical protein ABJ251_19555 [Paracoccaceae bacterium]